MKFYIQSPSKEIDDKNNIKAEKRKELIKKKSYEKGKEWKI